VTSRTVASLKLRSSWITSVVHPKPGVRGAGLSPQADHTVIRIGTAHIAQPLQMLETPTTSLERSSRTQGAPSAVGKSGSMRPPGPAARSGGGGAGARRDRITHLPSLTLFSLALTRNHDEMLSRKSKAAGHFSHGEIVSPRKLLVR